MKTTKGALFIIVLLLIYSSQVQAETSFFHSNHLMSTSVLSDKSGNVSGEFQYFPYGEIFSETQPELIQYSYTDQESDRETKLYYYGARYYDSQLGRFLSPDPLRRARPAELQPYAYVENNPLRYIDPLGLSALDVDPPQSILDQALGTARSQKIETMIVQDISTGDWIVREGDIGGVDHLPGQKPWGHIHPSGNLTLSPDDIELMSREFRSGKKEVFHRVLSFDGERKTYKLAMKGDYFALTVMETGETINDIVTYGRTTLKSGEAGLELTTKCGGKRVLSFLAENKFVKSLIPGIGLWGMWEAARAKDAEAFMYNALGEASILGDALLWRYEKYKESKSRYEATLEKVRNFNIESLNEELNQ